jgi:hypothetical protein
MQIAFEAPSLNEAKDIAEPLAKEFLDYLTFASNLRTRLRDLRHIFNWEPGNDGNRECAMNRGWVETAGRAAQNFLNHFHN